MITVEELDRDMMEFWDETRRSRVTNVRPAAPQVHVDTSSSRTERTPIDLPRTKTLRTSNSDANPNNSVYG